MYYKKNIGCVLKRTCFMFIDGSSEIKKKIKDHSELSQKMLMNDKIFAQAI